MLRPRTPLRIVLVASLACLVAAGSGCLYAGAAVGAKFVTGNADGPVEASPEQTAAAARAVLRDSGFTLTEDRVEESGEIEIEGVNEDERTARLKIKPVSNACQLSVRVGLLGDQDESQLYFNRIKKRAER